jgi:C-terminal processing protease CtpA/Prc
MSCFATLQSVTELRDGSALFVTVAKYLSPALHQIDHIGIAPDVKCTPDEVVPVSSSGGGSTTTTGILSLDGDSCIITAEHQLDLQ